MLDIGTDPGPSIYALNDFIPILNKYGSLYKNSKLASLNIAFESLERSNDFPCFVKEKDSNVILWAILKSRILKEQKI